MERPHGPTRHSLCPARPDSGRNSAIETMESRSSNAASSVTTLLIISKAAKEVNQIVLLKNMVTPYRE